MATFSNDQVSIEWLSPIAKEAWSRFSSLILPRTTTLGETEHDADQTPKTSTLEYALLDWPAIDPCPDDEMLTPCTLRARSRLRR
jgi:hypothetical protein